MAMLGDAHRPAHDYPLATAVHARGQLDVGQRQAGLRLDVLPRRGIYHCQVLVDAMAMFGNESMVEHGRFALGLGFAFPLQGELGHAAQHRHVAAQCRAEERGVGRPVTVGQHLQRVLRVLETLQATFLQRVYAHHLGATLHRIAQRVEHARVVGAGVLAPDENRVGMLEIVEGDGALANPDALPEGHATGLVAHVRTVGEVVGAVSTHE